MIEGIAVKFSFIQLLVTCLLTIVIINRICLADDTLIAAKSYMRPTSPYRLLVNDTLDIFCSVEDPRDMIGNKLGIYSEQRRLNTTIINSTTIHYKIDHAPMMHKQYTCKYGTSGVAVIEVFIGLRPQNVVDFKCRSYNWLNLNCTFNEMPNPIQTEYKLHYYVEIFGISQGRNCELKEMNNNGHYCELAVSNGYRQTYENYVFNLSSLNFFDKHEQIFKINNFASVIPEKILNLNYTNATSNSVVLTWQLNAYLKMWKHDFIFDVRILSNKCVLKSSKVNLDNLTHKNINYILPIQLEYAHTWYEVEITYRSALAPDIKEMWAEKVTVVFSSLSRIPDNPPITDIGGFHYKDNKDLIIYWKELPVCRQNGNKSNYQLTKPPKNKTNMWAKYEHMNLNENFEVKISSSNHAGSSFNQSKIIVPNFKSIISKPSNLKKFLINGNYIIKWNKPHNVNNIEDYTIFWCTSKDQQADECESSIDFEHVNRTTFEFNYPANDEKPINFAISANTKNSSSGMLWAMCTVSENKDIDTKLSDLWIEDVTETSMNIKWKLGCTDETLVKGFSISYCPKVSILHGCNESLIIKNSTDKNGYLLENLRPYTIYKLTVSMYSNTKMGPPSHEKENTTKEGIPTPPRNLKLINVTSTTIILSWDDPEYWNGHKQLFEITYNDRKIINNYEDNKPASYILQYLNGSSEYNISIKACTQRCSNSSNIITVKTDVGAPSMINEVRLSGGISKPLINWNDPTIPNGELSYYELRINIYKNKNVRTLISKVKNKRCNLLQSICDPNTEEYDISVRAVNVNRELNATPSIIENDEICDDEDKGFFKNTSYYPHLKGEWSKPETRPCENNTYGNFYLNIVIFCCGIIILVWAIVMALKKFRKMKDIGIELPAGIEDIIKDSKPKISDNNLNKTDKKDDDFTSEQEKKKLIQSVHNSQLSLENNSQCGSSDFCESNELDEAKDNEQNGYEQQPQDDDAIHPKSVRNLENFNNNDQLKAFMVDNSIMQTLVYSMEQPQQQAQNIFPPKFQVMPNGYVSASAFTTPNSNGYIQQQPLPRIVNSGYTPISALTSLNKNIIDSPHLTPINVKTSVPASPGDHVISGYVTHKQLSDFGHRMQ